MDDFSDFYYAAILSNWMGKPVISQLKTFNSDIKRDGFVNKSTLHIAVSLEYLKEYYGDDFESAVEESIFNMMNPSF